MEGYPVGTKCVITWVGGIDTPICNLGDVVTCGAYIGKDSKGVLLQEIDIPCKYAKRGGWEPRNMRPLEDPDESIMDIMEDILELVK